METPHSHSHHILYNKKNCFTVKYYIYDDKVNQKDKKLEDCSDIPPSN